MKIYKNVGEMVGNTPIMELYNIERKQNLNALVLAKLECFNPGGSAKDRVALEMIESAEQKGDLHVGSTIIEPTSGNTGIGLALVAAARGYRVILTMPESMSVERRQLLSAYGAEIVLTDASLGMSGAIAKANEIAKNTPDSYICGQFDNMANPASHYKSTGPEIWRDTDGKVDIFVACVGTGGTLSGVGKYLKEQNPNIKIVAVEPEGSPVLSGGKAGAHKIQGIGAGFVPSVLDTEIYDEVICVSDIDAFSMTKTVAREEGILVGISSGACVHVAISLANRAENKGKTIVALLPDTGERYLSAGVYNN